MFVIRLVMYIPDGVTLEFADHLAVFDVRNDKDSKSIMQGQHVKVYLVRASMLL